MLSRSARNRAATLIEEELRWREACRGDAPFFRPSEALARRHLLAFILYCNPDYLPGWVHVDICAALDRFLAAVQRKERPRLILTMPPRHGKSEIVSRLFPVYWLGRNPGHEVVVSSYGQDLSDGMSAAARQYREAAIELWGHLVPRIGGKDSTKFWEVEGGGSYKAVGVGGPLTGSGFNVGIIDDPIKNHEEAESPTEREKVWNWYRSTFRTRAAPGAGVVVMATRWHHDDLIGRITYDAMQRGTEDRWNKLEFPAIAERDEPRRKAGEALHPERYDLATLGELRRDLGERQWNALYQCRPTSDQGGTFQRSWYQIRHSWDPVVPPEAFTEKAISIDANFKDASTAAMASVGLWGRIEHRRYIRLAELRGQFSYVALRQRVKAFADIHRPTFILIEEAANGIALLSDLASLGYAVIPFKPQQYGSKLARAEVAARDHEAGKIELLQAEWTEAWIEEHTTFPLGRFKDRVDEGSQIVIYWQESARKTETGNARIEANKALMQILGRSR